MTAQPTAAGWILRLGSTAGIVGALLGWSAPSSPGNPTGDPEGVARAIADSQLWSPITSPSSSA